MKAVEGNTVVLPYAVFGFASVTLIMGGMLGMATSLQLQLIISEIVFLLGATLVARSFISNVIMDVELPRLVCSKGEGRFPGCVGLSSVGFLWTVLTMFPLVFFTNSLANIIAKLPFLEEAAEAYAQRTSALLPLEDPIAWAIGAVGIVIAAPLAEEVLFRGTLLPLLRQGHDKLRLHWVLLINGLLFGLMHLNIFGFLSLVVLGVYFADVATRSRTVVAPIVAHSVYNALSGVVYPLAVFYWEGGNGAVDLFGGRSTAAGGIQSSTLMTLGWSAVALGICWKVMRARTQVDSFYSFQTSLVVL